MTLTSDYKIKTCLAKEWAKQNETTYIVKLQDNKITKNKKKFIDRENIEMRVYKRGAGETLACGTGACATAVSAILNGYCDNKVTIHLLGGDLLIEWSGNENDSVIMTGPAEYAFTGEVEI